MGKQKKGHLNHIVALALGIYLRVQFSAGIFLFFFLQVTIVKTVLTGYVVVIWSGSMTCQTPFFETIFVFVCVRVYCFRVNQMVNKLL